jgi:hypothetical protein
MSEYTDRFDKWQREAKEKLENIDKQLGISEKLGDSAKAIADTAQKGAEKIKHEAERSQVGKHAVKAAEETIKTAEAAAKKAWDASEPIRDAAAEAASDVGGKAASVAGEAGKTAGDVVNTAGKKAGEVFDNARETVTGGVERVSKIFHFGAGWSRTIDSAFKTVSNTTAWVAENPLKAATTGVSVAVGAGLGAVFTGISSHWLFNSALPAWSVKKLSEQFTGYLKSQRELIEKGELSEADTERVKFEHDIVKQIGAPLLGAFSFASGAVMMTNVLNPKTVTGAPISWLLGGNPLLEGVWFFGNGMVCFKTSYDFFMIALEDHGDVQNMVKEIKGLLPSAAANPTW